MGGVHLALGDVDCLFFFAVWVQQNGQIMVRQFLIRLKLNHLRVDKDELHFRRGFTEQ